MASSGVFNSLLLCLKNDRDIMVVTHALVSLTMLLPCLCSFLGPNLSELFGILVSATRPCLSFMCPLCRTLALELSPFACRIEQDLKGCMQLNIMLRAHVTH